MSIIKHFKIINSTKINLFVILFFITAYAIAKPPKQNNNQWAISIRTGMALFLSEYSSGFLENEFKHQPGYVFNFDITRTLGKHWEPGIKFSLYHISGESELPEFSANGVHSAFSRLYQVPVEYKTDSRSFSVFCRYYFREFPDKSKDKIRFDPFVELGGGINIFTTELSYQSNPISSLSPVIFQKGTGDRPTPGDAVQYNVGAGTRLRFNKTWDLLTSFNMEVIDYGCLDAVHNYDKSGERINAKGIIAKFMIGVIIPISNRVSSKTSRNSRSVYLPWAP